MNIEKMTVGDLGQVVSLHLKTLPTTASSLLGAVYLRYLYSKLLTEAVHHICLVSKENKKVIGVLTATKDFKKTQKIMNPLTSFELLQIILTQLLLDKAVRKKLVQLFLFQLRLSEVIDSSAGILTIFVDPVFRRKNIAERMLRTFLLKVKTKQVFVDTKISNIPAGNFYTKMGFKKHSEVYGNVIFSWSKQKSNKTNTS